MSGSQTFQRLTQETIEEHHQIHFFLDQVAQTLKSFSHGSADVRRVEVDRLRSQHEKMLEILEMARIHAQCGEATEADGLRVDLEEFLEMFRQHERDEEDLLRMALERDNSNQK